MPKQQINFSLFAYFEIIYKKKKKKKKNIYIFILVT